MTVSTGRDFLAIPGPTTVPDRVLNAMHQPAIDIYSPQSEKFTTRCLESLKWISRTKTGRPYIYIANGHGAWEAALSNTLSRGDKVLVLGTGRFALGWAEMGAMLGIEFDLLDFGWQDSVNPDNVAAKLRDDISGSYRAVLVVQIDTASGVVNDIAAIRQAINEAGHDALYMVDTIASLATMPYEMDAWGVDVTVAGCQKGLMTPPGLSFVVASEKAWDAHQTASLKTLYWDWTAREGTLHYNKYCGTPPEHLLFGLYEAFDMLEEEGLEAVWRRHAILANAVRAAVSVWQEAGSLELNIKNPDCRSNAVTTVLMKDPSKLPPVFSFCQDVCNVTIGIGIGDLDGKAFRIAHMGYCNAPMTLGVLSTLDLAFKKLDLAHGEGAVAAAINEIASQLS